jgi:hypothetical protein
MIPRAIISVLLFITFTARAETPGQFFDEANQAYQKGTFTEAIEKYERLVQGGFLDADVFYNLGNAYFKSGNVPKAILNYERALKLNPNDDDLRHNLQFANLMLTDRIEPAPRLFVWDWWDSIKTAFSLDGVVWLCYVLYVLVIGSIILVMIARSYAVRKAGFIAGIVFAVLFAGSLVLFTGNLNRVQRSDMAIITASVTTIKNSPDPQSSDAFVLHGGVKVFITDRVNHWFKIRLADGKVGWMEQQAAEII